MSIIDKTSEYFMTCLFGKVNMFIDVSDYESLSKILNDFKKIKDPALVTRSKELLGLK